MAETMANAAKTAPGKNDADRLREISNYGNSERVRELGDYILQRMGLELPRRMVTFTYAHYGTNGEVIAPERVPLQHNVNVPPGMKQQKGTSSADTFDTTNQIEGEYQIFVNGVPFQLARGREDGSILHPVTNKQMVVVIPETQNIFGKHRQVDPMEDPEHYLWLWMHPRNVGAPCNMSRQEMAKIGIDIRKTGKFLTPNGSPKIKANAGTEARHKAIETTNETGRLTVKVANLNDIDLKRMALATGVRPLEIADDSVPMPQVYRSHLYNVLNDNTGMKASVERRAKLVTMLDGGDGFYKKIIDKAISIGALVQDGTEFYLVEDGVQSQPDVLARYVVAPEQVEFAADWLSMKLEHDKRENLIHIIDVASTKMSNATYGGREASNDAVAAIDRAFFLGKLVEVQTLNKGNGNWQLEDGTVLCTWKGMSKDDKRKSLMAWASSISLPALLATLGLTDDAS
jgi:hypothetical protein